MVWLALSAQDVFAQSMNGKIYGRLSGGALMLNDIDFAGSASSGGITYTANASYSFDVGAAAAGAIGYRYNRWIAFEGEIGYATLSYDSVSGTFTASGNGSSVSVTGSAPVDGDVTMISGLFNLIVTPFGVAERFSPYGGGGFGVVHIKDEINSIGGDTSVRGSATADDLVADLLLGFDAVVGETFSVGGQYRYLWIDSGSAGVDNATAHTFLATGKLAF